MVDAGVSPGIAIISSPTEHTQVMASSFSRVSAPADTASIILWSSDTGINAPDSPPTYEDAITPPFLTWSFSNARAAVVPGAPAYSSPISSSISPTLSPIAGVGARERSTIPNGTPSIFEACFATSWPTLVTLNAVFFIVSQSTSKLSPRTFSRAFLTTPGPLTPTLITQSPSVTPWKAPAINGLSSGALQNTTNLQHPRESSSFVSSAVSTIISPISFTASMSIPVFVEPTFTELHTFPVEERASGMDLIRSSSAAVIPLFTSAEYPPIKFTPIVSAALSRAFASFTKSPVVLHTDPPTSAIGVTDTLLFTIGIPYFLEISFPTETRSFA